MIRASGPIAWLPNRDSNLGLSNKVIVPNPRRSQKMSGCFCFVLTISRTCWCVGGDTLRSSPVIRGSKTKNESVSSSFFRIRRTARLPRRVISRMRAWWSLAAIFFGRGLIGDGFWVSRGNWVVAMTSPRKQAIPRHIVSTSGSSGIDQRNTRKR